MTDQEPRSPRDVPDITLAEFLRARLDEDEQAARAATQGRWALDELEDVSDLFGQLVSMGETRTWRVADVGNRAYRYEGGIRTFDARHIARHGPLRVLAEVDTKRRIVAMHEHDHSCVDATGVDDYAFTGPPRFIHCATLRLLAHPFAGHPEYRVEEWAP